MTWRSKFMIEHCISCRQLQTHRINFNYKALLFPFMETLVMSFDFLLFLVELKFSHGSDE